MCGICCIIPLITAEDNRLEKPLKEILQNRGPDIQHEIHLTNGLAFYGFVLWQQGNRPTMQPVESDKFILLFNGDIFNAKKESEASDTSWLMSELDACTTDENIIQLMKLLKGPYSLVIYSKVNKSLYFARDPLGRNSLLLGNNGSSIGITSSSYISGDTSTIEIPSLGLFKLQVESLNCTLYPWDILSEDQNNSLSLISSLIGSNVEVLEAIGVKYSAPVRQKPLFNFLDTLKTVPRDDNLFGNLLAIDEVANVTEHLSRLLRKSIEDRVQNTPRYCSVCIKPLDSADSNSQCQHAKIGVLFSGGIDCTILAAIAHEFIPASDAIDLINVAFEPISKASSNYENFNVPDRVSAHESLTALKKLFPERQWNLIEVDVSRSELQDVLQKHICHLIYPLETVLDESLGCAFWFASRGIGQSEGLPYTSTCRVILVGSGADELFGGYTRHRNAYSRCEGDIPDKIKALDDELRLDWDRIPTRNLGRDDRIIADNGRTSRAPFIEESLVNFVTQLHPLDICCFDLEQGVGDKLLLRLLGYKLGLRTVTRFKKRAIQFGSRIANKNQNAKDRSVYLCFPSN